MRLIPYDSSTYANAPSTTRIITAVTTYVTTDGVQQILLTASKWNNYNVIYVAYVGDSTIQGFTVSLSNFEDMFYPAFLVQED